MANIRFYLLEATFQTEQQQNVLYLYGRTENGQDVIAIDETYAPSFYVESNDIRTMVPKVSSLSIEQDDAVQRVIRVEIISTAVQGKQKEFLKVTVNTQKAMKMISDIILHWESTICCYEHDIPLVKKYLLEKKVTPLSLLEAEGEWVTKKRNMVLSLTSLQQSDTGVKEDFHAVSFDMVWENEAIIMISFSTDTVERTITWKLDKPQKNIEIVQSEEALIQVFIRFLREHKPDVLIGYNSDEALQHLAKRAQKYFISLELGCDNSGIRPLSTGGVKILLPVHLDFYQYVRQVLSREHHLLSLQLTELAGYFLDYTPLDKNQSPFSFSLERAKLLLQLFHLFLPELVESVKQSGLSLFEVCRNALAQQVEQYLMREMHTYQQFIPPLPTPQEVRRRQKQTFTGGFVLEPKPGLYENVLVYDFSSMYPSIIVTYNIDPSSYHCQCCRNNAAVSKVMDEPLKAWFCQKKKSYFTKMVQDLLDRRQRIHEIQPHDAFLKAREKRVKHLTNAIYGTLGFARSRWYHLESARVIASIGRFYIKKTIQTFHEKGCNVVYGDTDSVFICLDTSESKQKVQQVIQELNTSFPDSIQMEEEADMYPKALFVGQKDESSGAKKKYALLDSKGKVIIKGFEGVKKNYSKIVRDAQIHIIRSLLRENDKDKIFLFTHKIIDRLSKGKVSLQEVMLSTTLSKDPLNYETRSPPVRAALRMRERGQAVSAGTMVKYIIAKGEGSIADRARLPTEVMEGEYDSSYYIHHQLLPALDRIFDAVGIDKEEMFAKKDQSSLTKFLHEPANKFK